MHNPPLLTPEPVPLQTPPPPPPDTTYSSSVTTFMKPPLAKPPTILANKYDATPISQILH